MASNRINVSGFLDAEGINGEIQALHMVFKATGKNIPFATMMGISGLAFRIYWHAGKEDDGTAGVWSESSLEACGGMHPLYLACQYFGYTYSPYDQNSLDDLYEHVRESVDKGFPVIGRGPGAPVPCLFIGYAEEGTRKLDVINRLAGEQITQLEIPMVDLPLTEYGHWLNPCFVIGKQDEPPSPDMQRFFTIDAFQRTIESVNPQVLDGGRWVGGKDAYEALATDLEKEDLAGVWPGFDPEDDERVYFLDSFLRELGRARGAAFEFLDTLADDFPVGGAARAYEEVYDIFNELRALFPDSRKDYAAAKAAFDNHDTRKQLAEKLRGMLEAETKAAQILEKKMEKIMEMEMGEADDFV